MEKTTILTKTTLTPNTSLLGTLRVALTYVLAAIVTIIYIGVMAALFLTPGLMWVAIAILAFTLLGLLFQNVGTNRRPIYYHNLQANPESLGEIIHKPWHPLYRIMTGQRRH